VGASQSEMSERPDGFKQHNARPVQDFLELGCGFSALATC
jgi:hypothetical protein